MNTDYIVELDKNYEQQVKRMLEAAKTRVKQWIALPNNRCQWMSAPRGACVVLDAEQPVFADLFCTNMFQGTSIREVAFDDAGWTASSRQQVLRQMLAVLPERSPAPPNLHSKDESWVESLGEQNAYVGLFNARCRDTRSERLVTKWYLVVRAGLDEHVLEKLEDHLLDLEDQQVSASAALLDDPVVKRARELASQNRRRLMANVASTLNLDVPINDVAQRYQVPFHSATEWTMHDVDLSIEYVQSLFTVEEQRTIPFWFHVPNNVDSRFDSIRGFAFGPLCRHMLDHHTDPRSKEVLDRVKEGHIAFRDAAQTCGSNLEMEHYVVDRCDGELVYYNDCSSTLTSGGVVLDQGLRYGPLLLTGPVKTSALQGHGLVGCSWTNAAFSSFPSSTGLLAGDAAASTCAADSSTFLSAVGTKSPYFNTRFRPRNKAHLDVEHKLGWRGSDWNVEAVALYPYLVVSSSQA